MSISASDVKKLRDMTGAGMMDAKKALSENDGDFDKAVKTLREKGLADSKKRADKEANQGTIGDYIHYQQDRAVSGVLVELACETDFVAKSDEFKNVAKQIAMHVAALKPEFLNIEVIEAPDNGQIVLKIENTIPANVRGIMLLELEEKLKSVLDKGISLWLEPVGDKSKLRKLRGIQINS